jgi:transcriptional regulator with XRE-family HTH domain
MQLAEQMRDARLRAALTQAELAARVGTSQPTLSAYERGRKVPSLDTLGRLAAATGFELEFRRALPPVSEPSLADHRKTARGLADVLALAAALPSSPEPELRFPRLPIG